MNKGFIVLAQNTKNVNYVKCAEVLANSIRRTMPAANVTLISNDIKKSKYFDKVIKLPYGDLEPNSDWKLINDWQVYEASPYDYTIKLEADMFIPSSIDYWWDVLMHRDVVVANTIRNFKQEISDIKAYRRFIVDNKLPNVYNAITYFKKGPLAEKFFGMVRTIFENWHEFTPMLKCNPDEKATTDWVYAIACHIMGEENTTMPFFKEMSMVHMKQFINGMPTENWTDTLIYEILPETLRINTFPQRYPFHYTIKNFSDKLAQVYK